MAFEFYVTIEGAKQGMFKGESLRKGFENKISGLKFSYELTSPRDVDTGLASGKRQHTPVALTKEWGPSTPQFLQALTDNEVLTTVVFQFAKMNKQGAEVVYHIIKLTNASVSNLKWTADETEGERDPHARPELEEVSFTFETIEVQSAADATRASDTWGQ